MSFQTSKYFLIPQISLSLKSQPTTSQAMAFIDGKSSLSLLFASILVMGCAAGGTYPVPSSTPTSVPYPVPENVSFVLRGLTESGTETPAGSLYATWGRISGAVGQGVSISVVKMEKNSVNTPHVHTDAAEMALVTKGCIKVGAVSPKGEPLERNFCKGDVVLVPAGFVHWAKNGNDSRAEQVRAYSCDYPKTEYLNFLTAGIPNDILRSSFQVGNDVVKQLKKDLDIFEFQK